MLDLKNSRNRCVELNHKAIHLFEKAERFRKRGLYSAANITEDSAQRYYDESMELWEELDELSEWVCVHANLKELFDCEECSELLEEI